MSFFDRKIVPAPIGPSFKWPTTADRVAIVGKTGSGKTQFGGWLLSEAPFDRQPYVIVDYKREKLFRGIERSHQIDYKEIPTKPGVYRLEALPHEEEKLEKWLWGVWRKGRIGLFFDEGYLVNPFSDAWRAILVTGRSLEIPAFTLSQRPVSLPKWTVSEANYYAVFRLNWKKDRETVNQYIPEDKQFPENLVLPEYHSFWYDVSADQAFHLSKAPEASKILQRFDERLRPKRRVI